MAEKTILNTHDLFGVESTLDTKYTTKVEIPQYLPSAEMPSILSLSDNRKYTELLKNIHNSSVSDEEKDFLRKAATRHIIFNYSKIADYYSHATPEMQRLMEQSALVIIDLNDAIAGGYVKLSVNIRDIMEKTGRPVNDGDK